MNKLSIEYIETHIIDYCNLNCAGCSHFSPLVDNKDEKNLQTFKEEMIRLSELFNIKTIRIMGGEPLLNSKFMDYLLFTRRCFPLSHIVLVSNGILLNKLEPFISVFNDNNFILCISDYDLKYNLEIFNIFNKINYKYINNKNELYNVGLNLKGDNLIKDSYNLCDIAKNKWFYFQDGYLYQCCVMANIKYFNKFFGDKILVEQEDIGINIFNHSSEEIVSFLNTPHNACKYCNIDYRLKSYTKFKQSNKEISEWICH